MAVSTVKVTINGQTVTLTKPSSGNVWTGTMTAPSQSSGSNNEGVGTGVGSNAKNKGYYPATVVATDVAGNSTTVTDSHSSMGDSCKLKVLEKTAPTVVINYPTDGAYINTNKPQIKYTVSDSGSGVQVDNYAITLDGASIGGGKKSQTGSNGDASGTILFTPNDALAEGSHTIVVKGRDMDGNWSEEVSSTFTVDTVPPVLNISAPTDNLITNKTSVTVTGTTSDATSNPVTVTIKVGNGTAQTATVSNGAFSQAVTLAVGSNTITIVAKDQAGKTTTVTRAVTVDQTAPTITAISITPNPVDGGNTLSISVTVTDA